MSTFNNSDQTTNSEDVNINGTRLVVLFNFHFFLAIWPTSMSKANNSDFKVPRNVTAKRQMSLIARYRDTIMEFSSSR